MKPLMSDSNIHSIKLKGPWIVLRTPCETRIALPGTTVTIPFDWRALFGAAAGTAVFERRFNRPTGLTDEHRVRIVVREASRLQRLAVNDSSLIIEQRKDGAQLVDITRSLAPHNRLTIELSFDPGAMPQAPGGIGQPVILEIEDCLERGK